MYGVERKRHDNTNVCPICNEKLLSKRTFYRHVKNHQLYSEQSSFNEADCNVDSTGTDVDSSIVDTDELQSSIDETDLQASHASQDQIFSESIENSDVDNADDDYNDDNDDVEDTLDESQEDEFEIDHTPETWDNILEEEVDDDLGIPIQRRSGIEAVNDLLFWLLYFILYWQSVCHVSDNGIEWLLRFLFQFFNVLSLKINHALLSDFVIIFPTSIYMMRKLLKLDRDDFERFVVCTECFNVYNFLDCFTEVNGLKKTKLCSHETFRRGRGRKCNNPLLKEVILKGGIIKLYPYKVYCYNSLINGIEHILQKKDFPNLLCHWKDWQMESNIYRDVYDGAVWKGFGEFFQCDRNLGLMLNIDWFQPFKNRVDYSVGVIYFVIMNLPRNIRYKFENVIVVGLIPALKKEPKDLTPFLTPVVKELKVLWKGVRVTTSLTSIALTIRAALLCVACDIPAARKTCGFKSHSANLACHRCYKLFPASSFGAKRNYSGFDRQNWKFRTKIQHNKYAERVKNARNKTEFDNLSRKFGTYYSVLIELDYFDAVKFCIIDPMHNLFLGTSKGMFKLWLKKEILDEGKLELIEDRLKAMNNVTDIGRIPHKISSNYGSFTAEEWKNWTCVFSLYCLTGIIPNEHLKVWEKFVVACKILCSPFLQYDDIIKADQLLLSFCKSFEQLYSWEDVKPNMHLHCHLKECLMDYGPLHVFWCFSFERFNGKFGFFKINNRCVEIQFMRRITTARHCDKLGEIASNCEMFSEFKELFDTTDVTAINTTEIVNYLSLSKTMTFDVSAANVSQFITVPHVYKLKSLDDEDMVYLLHCYKKMYPSRMIEVHHLSEVVRKFGHAILCGERFGSKLDCRSLRSANVLANWNEDGDIVIQPDSIGLKPCRIEFFFSHQLYLDNITVRHVFAKVSWYEEYCEREKYGSHLQMWHFKKFGVVNSSTFVPVERIKCRFTYGLTGASKDLMLISPIPRKVYSDTFSN